MRVAQQAGVDVVWAANHWQLAVDAHAINHPNVDHACQDLVQADWTKLPSYELLLASPCCQGYSNASQPQRRAYHDAMRATAWAVIDCAEVTQPETILVENVPQFAKWQLFPLWMDALRVLGSRSPSEPTTRNWDVGSVASAQQLSATRSTVSR